MRCFFLDRTKDVAGVSGVGRVAQGVQFDNGKCVITWLGEHHTVTTHDSIESVEAIHCHGGNTQLTWIDPADIRLNPPERPTVCWCGESLTSHGLSLYQDELGEMDREEIDRKLGSEINLRAPFYLYSCPRRHVIKVFSSTYD